MSTDKTQFVVIGGAGRIAKYHFEAIEKVGGEVAAVIDPAGHIKPCYDDTEMYDSEVDAGYMPTSPEFFSICTPNHLHAEQSAWALKYGDVICEKPVALSISELDWLIGKESLGQTKVHPIMQMRYHPILSNLYEQFQTIPPNNIYLNYVVPRTTDYHNSWQGAPSKSGGIIFTIAIHILDFLVWTFGQWHDLNVEFYHDTAVYGTVKFNKTKVNFNFSTNTNALGRRILEFDEHVMDLMTPLPLHLYAYRHILNGDSLSLHDIKPTIQLCEEIRDYK